MRDGWLRTQPREKPFVPTPIGRQRRLAILQVVADYQDSTGWFPSVQEVTKRTGLASTSTTHGHITLLIDAGLLEQNDTHSQLRITEAGRAELPIPYLPSLPSWGVGF